MGSRLIVLCALCALGAAGCTTPGQTAYTGPSGAQQQSPSRDFCPDRLPVAQKRIRQAYASSQGSSSGGFTASVEGPEGESISVSVSSSATGVSGGAELGPSDVQTGLADLVFNCGKEHFSEKECFIDVYLDGEKLTSIGPTASGRVPLKCLPAGEHMLRIDSVAQTLFQGTIELESDVEHLAHVTESETGDHSFEIYARNPIPGRIPQPKTQVASEEGESTAHVEASGGGEHAETTVEVDEQASHGETSHHESSHQEAEVETSAEHASEEHHSETTVEVDEGSQTHSAKVEVNVETNESHHHGGEPDEEPGPSGAMTASQFADLKSRVEEESFSDGKIGLIETAAKHNRFKSAQVEELVGMLEFSDGRVKVAKMLYDRTVDKGNYYKVVSALEFESNKEEVREALDL